MGNAERQRRFRQRVNAGAMAKLQVRLEQAEVHSEQLLAEIERLSSEQAATCSRCGKALACPSCYQADPWGA